MAIIGIARDRIVTWERLPGYTLAQYMGTYMWLPMLLMGVMAIFTALGIGAARANVGADLFEEFTALRKANFETLGVLSNGFLLLGIGLLISSISFALARVAGILRVGGARVQDAAGRTIQTLVMPWTAWAFLMLMMMGLMIVIGGFIVHLVAAASIHDAWIQASGPGDFVASDKGFADTLLTWSGPVTRFGIASLFTGIVFALATIIRILRFQSVRLKEMAEERKLAG